jgi:translation elongation factor EF-1alpha
MQVMYKRKTERQFNTTMDLSVKYVETAKRKFTMTDAPGIFPGDHRDRT